MRVLVCGGRDFADEEWLFATLDKIARDRGPINCVIHGCAQGADTLADAWAERRSGGASASRAFLPTGRSTGAPLARSETSKCSTKGGPISSLPFQADAGPRIW